MNPEKMRDARKLLLAGRKRGEVAAQLGVSALHAGALMRAAKGEPLPKRAEICSRCGEKAESPYLCNACKISATLSRDQFLAAHDEAYLERRRAQRREYMRRKRAAP